MVSIKDPPSSISLLSLRNVLYLSCLARIRRASHSPRYLSTVSLYLLSLIFQKSSSQSLSALPGYYHSHKSTSATVTLRCVLTFHRAHLSLSQSRNLSYTPCYHSLNYRSRPTKYLPPGKQSREITPSKGPMPRPSKP